MKDLSEDENDRLDGNDDYNNVQHFFNSERQLTLAEERDEEERYFQQLDEQQHTEDLENVEIIDIDVADSQIREFNERLDIESTPDSDHRKNSECIKNIAESNNLTQQSFPSQVQLTKVYTASFNPKNTDIPSTSATAQKIVKSFTTSQKTNKQSAVSLAKHSSINLEQLKFPSASAAVQKNAKAPTADAQKAKGQSTAKRPCLTRIEWNNKIKRRDENINITAAVPTSVDRVEETFNAAIRDVLRNDGNASENTRTKFDSLGRYVADLNDMPKDEANTKERRILSILEN